MCIRDSAAAVEIVQSNAGQIQREGQLQHLIEITVEELSLRAHRERAAAHQPRDTAGVVGIA